MRFGVLKRVSLLPPDLRRWDQTDADGLCVTLCSDERPLRGATGLTDWRLCGAISRAILAGRLHGDEGEVMLMPAAGRLPFGKILLFGLGPEQSLSAAVCRDVCRQMAERTARLGLQRIVVSPPGRLHDRLSAPEALETLIDAMGDDHVRDVIVIESIAGQREMADVLRRLRPAEFIRDAVPG
jgi:hypothetical protein